MRDYQQVGNEFPPDTARLTDIGFDNEYLTNDFIRKKKTELGFCWQTNTSPSDGRREWLLSLMPHKAVFLIVRANPLNKRLHTSDATFCYGNFDRVCDIRNNYFCPSCV